MRGLCNDKLLAQSCVVHGNTFSIDHTLNGSCGGYLSIQHNELWDITVTLRINSAGVEPRLQPISGSTKQQMMLVGVVAENFLGRNSQMVYFDVKVFNPVQRERTFVPSYRNLDYEAKVQEVELGCFTQLVFSTSGGFGPAGNIQEPHSLIV